MTTSGAPSDPISSTRPAYVSASLYVGDLHPEVDETTLEKVFSNVGPIVSIRLCRDHVTRQSLGYAYVNYQNYEDAERALQAMNFKEIKGKQCRVSWSQRDPTIRKSQIGNLFVKNLPASVDNKKLYDMFSVFGNILSSKISTDENGKSRGYGFVQFESAEVAQKAINELNGKEVEGKALHVEPFKPQAQRTSSNFTNVFVKNLPEEWTYEDFQKYFSEFGKITSAMLAFDEEKKTSKCFGFVNYSTVEEAAAAIEKANGAEVGENKKKLYAGRAQSKSERARIMNERRRAAAAERIQKSANTNVYVKHLPDSMDDEAFRNFFGKFGTIVSARIMTDPATGRSRGFGFVNYSTQEEATKAITEAQGYSGFGKPLYVALHQNKEQRRAFLDAQHAARNQAMFNPMFMQGNPMMMNRMMMGGMRGMYPMFPGNMNMVQLQPAARFMRGPRMPGARQGRQFPQQGARPARTGAPRTGAPRVPQAQPQVVGVPPVNQNLDAATLAQMSPADAKQALGERLYPMVMELKPEHAPKITGMLLEMEISEVILLLENRNELVAKVEEAFAVLQEHQQ